ncbi:MAG: hypothetical protein ACYCY2_05095 [Acidithiobacillus ferriphilus]
MRSPHSLGHLPFSRGLRPRRGHPRVWGSLGLLYGLLTIGRGWRINKRDARVTYSDTFASRSRGAEAFWIDEAMGENKNTGINLIPEQNAKKVGGSDMTAVTIRAGLDLGCASGDRVS